MDAALLRERAGGRTAAASWLDPVLDAYVDLNQNRAHTVDQHQRVLGTHPGLRRKVARWCSGADTQADIQRIGKRRFFETDPADSDALYPI